MKKFTVFLAIILNFLTVLFAQSGRKITPMPTPTPRIEQTDVETGYSESKPTQRRSVSPLPSLRNVPQKNSQNQVSTGNAESSSNSQDDDVIRVETNLITIPVSVFDRNGLYVSDLTKENFKIFEDGKEQEIAYFATTEQPFTVVLLIDTSPSTEFKIKEIQDAAIAFVDQLGPQDNVMVIEFDANIHVLAEATTDRQKIYKAIRRADFGGGTSLYDAVDFTLRKRLNRVSGRKAIVLFSDGVDTTSGTSYDLSLREAEESDTVIFPIYYNTFFDNQRRIGFPPMRGTSRQEYMLGRQYLKDLADSTGGRVFNAGNTPGGLIRAFESIAEELRRQYSIGYIPSESGQAGQRKQIKVRVNRPNLIIRARDSYVVGEKAATTSNQTSR